MFSKDITELIPAPQIEQNFLTSVKERIVKRLKECGFVEKKFATEAKVILFVCVLIESAINKDFKLNKRELLIDMFREVYGLSGEDEILIKNTIELLHIGKKIKRKSYWKLYCASVAESFRL
jgi:hypothetical protein